MIYNLRLKNFGKYIFSMGKILYVLLLLLLTTNIIQKTIETDFTL